MNNSQFVQERQQQHYDPSLTPQQQNGQYNPSLNNFSYNHTEGNLNDQFSQLGLNNVPSLPPAQNNPSSNSNVNNFPTGPQVNTPQVYPPANFTADQACPPKQFSSSAPHDEISNQNVPPLNSFQGNNNKVPFSPFSGKNDQSNIHDGNSNQQVNPQSRAFINGTPDYSNDNICIKPNEGNANNLKSVQNKFGSQLNSSLQQPTGFPSTLNSSQFPQQTQSAFSIVPPQSRSQRTYPSTTGLSQVQQPQLVSSFPPQPPNSFSGGTPNTSQTQFNSSSNIPSNKVLQNGSIADASSHSQLVEQTQSTVNNASGNVLTKSNNYERNGPQQSGLPSPQLDSSEQLNSVPLKSEFSQQQLNVLSQPLSIPPHPTNFSSQQVKMPSQQPDFSSQTNSIPQQPGFPAQPKLTPQQPGFSPQQPGFPPQQSGFPPQQPGFPPQQPGFPPQSKLTSQQPGFPPQQPGFQPQQPGFPPQQPGFPTQQPGFPPQQPGFQPQQPGFPPQQQLGFPPKQSQQSGISSQQSNLPPQTTGFSQPQSGFPPQTNSLQSQKPGYLQQQQQQQGGVSSQQPISLPPQQPGFPPQPSTLPSQPTGFPPQPGALPSQPTGFPPQPSTLPSQPTGFPPQPGTLPSQPTGFPPQSGNMLSRQSGFPPQQPGFPPQQQPGFPPQQQPGFPPQQPGFPPQQPSFPSQQQSGLPPQQQPGFPPQQQPGFPPQHQGFPPQQPGFPPQQPGSTPGYPQQPGFAQGTPAYMGQPAPSRRLDPDQMPSPVQVIQDDQQSKCGNFLTNQRGLVPPLVTTDFTVQDGGNASPRFIRSTMYCVPTTTDIMKQTSVPFGLVISPMAKIKPDEYPPPIINTGEVGPVRCKRCKAYMSPFMQFIDGGKHFVCLLCKASTEVPVEYFQHLDHTGQRLDRSERPELCFGSYEFIVPKEYCRKEMQPKPPAYIFVIDVSYNNIKSGLVRLICAFMKELLTQLPTELGEERSKIRVGFITYDTTVHFYNIKETLAVPQMMVVGDTTDMFMPLLDGFLCDPGKSSHVIDALMEQIPTQFNETRTTETVLLPAIKAGMEALKNADCCGKLFVFNSSLPIAEAPGKLKNREDRKLLATDKEKSILNPQTNVYKELGEECVQVGCSVDLFITNNSFIDLATIGQISKISGGEIFKYSYFQAEFDGQRFLSDLKHDISRPTVFDAVMRVRTSTGTRPTDFYGHFFMSNSTDVELSAIDCDKAIAIEVKHDDKLDEQDGVMIQTAMLYTSCSGQRRVRILNLALRTSGQMGELYRSCDLDTIMNFFGKQVMYKILESSGRQVKEAITNKTAQILATYRKHCASPSSAGQLILPECMKLMPLYVNCLIKCDAMSGGPDMTVDDRWYNMHLVITADIPTTLGYFYPRLIPIHTLADETSLDDPSIPDQLRCSIEKFSENGAYILENGVYMFLWLGMNLSQTFLSEVFGVQNITHVNTERSVVPILNNPLNKAIHQVLSKVQEERSHTMRLTIVRQKDKLETVMRHFLVEDHGIDNSPSYVEFLCHMHKEIRNLLS